MPVFGRFETVREISQTGLGSVWTAREAGGDTPSLSATAMLRSTLNPTEQYVIKLFQPMGVAPGDTLFDAEAEIFLQRCEAQRRAVRAGAKHWARIHDAGRFDEGAYCVQDAHARSVQQLLVRKVDLWRNGASRDPGSILRSIILGTVEALRELARASAGRGHGALKPSNILLAGEGPLASATIILTDPLPDPREDGADHTNQPPRAPAYTSRDRRDLGALIFQLVTHRPYREPATWPVQNSPEWAQYGRRGGPKWLDLCNRLLDPRESSTPPTLDELIAELNDWPIERASRTVPAIIAAVLLLVAGAGGIYIATRPPPRPVLILAGGQLDQLKDDINWIDGLASIPNDPAIAASARTDLALAEILRQIDNYKKSETVPRAIKYLRYERNKGDLEPTEQPVKEGVSDLWQIYQPLTAALGDWPAPARLNDTVKAFESRGWPRAAATLDHARRLYDTVLTSRPSQPVPEGQPAPPTDIRYADSIRGVIELSRASSTIESDWASLQTLADNLAQTNDPILKLYQVALAGQTRAADTGADPLGAIQASLTTLRGVGADIETARAAHYQKADLEFFAEDSEVYQQLAKAQAASGGAPASDDAVAILRAWPAQIANPRYIREPIGDVWAGRGVADEVSDAVKDLEQLNSKREPEDEAKLTPMSEQLTTIQSKLAELQKRLEAPRRRDYDVIRADAKTLLASLDTLNHDLSELKAIRLRAFEEYLPEFRALKLASGSTVLDAEFTRVRDAIDRRHAPAKNIADLRSRIRRTQAALEDLAKLPRVEGLTGATADIVNEEREAVFAHAIKSLPRDDEGIPVDKATQTPAFTEVWSARTAAYDAWLVAARAALVEADAITRALADGYGPTYVADPEAGTGAAPLALRWSVLSQEPAFAKLLERQPSFKAIDQRFADLRTIDQATDRAALLRRLQTADAPLAESLAAWNRLRSLAPAWPAAAEDLGIAQSILADHLKPAIAAAATPERRQQLTVWAADQSRTAWTSAFAALPAEPAQIDAAIALAPAFGVDESAFSALPPQARYNLLLHNLRADLIAMPADGSEQQDEPAKARLRRFDADVAALQLSDASSATALTTLRDMVNAPAKKEIKLSDVGPAKAGWTESESDPGGAWVAYRSPAAVNPARLLRFIRVSQGGGAGSEPTVYVGETEISIGLFSAIIEGGKGGSETASALARRMGASDTRKGPSAWSLVRADARTDSRSPVETRNARQQVGRGWLNVFAGGTAGEAYHPDGLVIAPPTDDSPMNYIPASTALYAARLVNCRIPTSDEWKAAAALNRSGSANLRDSSWASQLAFVAALTRPNPLWPDADIFVPDELKASLKRQSFATPAVTTGDRYVWFAPVNDEGAGDLFKHVTGNVAEFVFDNRDLFDAMPREDVLRHTDWRGLKVIGASALSPAEVKADTAYAVTSANAWFSDVGFRLAFTAGEGKPLPLAKRASEVAAQTPYLAAK